MEGSKETSPALFTHYWRRVRRLTRLLLTVWALLVMVVVVGGPSIDIAVYGVPLAYWLISSLLLPGFLVLVLFYAWRMDVIESATMENSNECLNLEAAPQQNTSRPDSGDSKDEAQSARSDDPSR